jgi:hypothetical protein
MQTNESIIAVPITVEQSGQTRQFLVRLVERLDLVIGTRGGDPYVPESKLNETQVGLTKLEQTVLEIIERLLGTADSETVAILIAATQEATNAEIEALKSSSAISNASATAIVMGASYNQVKAQNAADHTAAVAVQLNSLLTALRGTEIIAT